MYDFCELTVEGNVTADLEVKTGEKKQYIYFSIANNKGPKDNQRTSFYQCWVFGEECQRMVDKGVKKGSRIRVIGELEMSPYERKDGTKTISPKVTVHHWEFVSGGKKPDTQQGAQAPGGALSSQDDFPVDLPDAFDCGDDGLPL